MKANIRQHLRRRKRRLQRRLDQTDHRGCHRPMFTASDIHLEIAERAPGLAGGGIGASHALARHVGLIEAIDRRLHLLKFHVPYHESDHLLTFAYKALGGGTCLQDLERRRQDEVFRDARGARRLPDPTSAGDGGRRFSEESLRLLQDIVHDGRVGVWAEPPADFFDQAVIDMDGFLVETTGQCKQGMDSAADGTWGDHALVLSLANTGAVRGLVNRSGNRPSQEGAAAAVDGALAVCVGGGFRQVLLRGDTDFSQTEHLDRGHAEARVRFVCGDDATPNLVAPAADLPARAWKPRHRPPHYQVRTRPRRRPDNVQEASVVRREFDHIKWRREDVAEFNYRPAACPPTYRRVVLRKNLSVEKGERVLFDDVRYFFSITNDWVHEAEEVVFTAHDRCDQENLLAQLAGGVRALRAPVDNLTSNGAFRVMTALAWDLKAWWALVLPERPGRWRARHQAEKRWVLGLEFKTFVNALVRRPCPIVRTGGRLV